MTDATPDTAPADADAERPAHARSPLWDHRERIERMLAERYSYEQIARALGRRGVELTASEIGKWCRRQGLRSAAPSRHDRTRLTADKKPAPSAPPAPSLRPLADAFGPPPSDPLADLRPTSSTSFSRSHK